MRREGYPPTRTCLGFLKEQQQPRVREREAYLRITTSRMLPRFPDPEFEAPPQRFDVDLFFNISPKSLKLLRRKGYLRTRHCLGFLQEPQQPRVREHEASLRKSRMPQSFPDSESEVHCSVLMLISVFNISPKLLKLPRRKGSLRTRTCCGLLTPP